MLPSSIGVGIGDLTEAAGGRPDEVWTYVVDKTGATQIGWRAVAGTSELLSFIQLSDAFGGGSSGIPAFFYMLVYVNDVSGLSDFGLDWALPSDDARVKIPPRW